MKQTITVTLLFLTLAGAAHAQLRKCTGPDGKVTYSDVLCNTNATAGTIKNPGGNSVDSSGLRRQAQQNRESEASASADSEIENGMQNPPLECKFAKMVIGDAKGRVLAENAKRECLQNLQAAKRGQPKSMEAYTLWKDNLDQVSRQRQFTAGQANATINSINTRSAIENSARQTQDAIRDVGRQPKGLTCKPDPVLRQLNCN